MTEKEELKLRRFALIGSGITYLVVSMICYLIFSGVYWGIAIYVPLGGAGVISLILSEFVRRELHGS
jgi:hypothetical protein